MQLPVALQELAALENSLQLLALVKLMVIPLAKPLGKLLVTLLEILLVRLKVML